MGEITFTNPPGNKPSINIVDTKRRDLWRFYSGASLVSRCNYLGQIISTAGQTYKYIQVGLGDIAADSDAFRYPLMRLPYAVTVYDIHIGTDTTLAANATNYQTIAAKDADGNTIASITTASTGFTAATPRTMGTISSTYGALIANEGLYLTFTKAASGAALSGAVVFVIFTVDNEYTNSISITDAEPPLISFVDSPDAAEVILSDRVAGSHLNFNNGALEIDVNGKIRTTSIDKYHVAVHNVGAVDVSGPTPAYAAILKPSATVRILRIYISADTSLALGGDTNYAILSFQKYNGSSGFEMCRATTSGPYSSGTALTYGVFSEIADVDDNNINEQYNELTSSDTLWLVITKAGTGGTDLSNLTIQALYEKIY